MKKIVIAVLSTLVAGGAYAAPDWSKVPAKKINAVFPGQSALEWVMNKADHSAVPDITNKKAPCAKCHEGDAADFGKAIVEGKPVGDSKKPLEPEPIAGKAGSVPVNFQAAHDGSKIYFRLEFADLPGGGKKMDSKNEMKVAIMFDGGQTVAGANENGCWSTCHDDLRSMKAAKDDKKTKYIKGADLASGKFMDLIQWRSGEKKNFDGFIDGDRKMDGGKSLTKAEGKKDGSKWVVTFERDLAGKGKGDHTIAAGKTYNFGFAIHDDYSNARYHYVSFGGYQFALDADAADPKRAKQHVKVQKQ
jgi:hypothetical protein